MRRWIHLPLLVATACFNPPGISSDPGGSSGTFEGSAGGTTSSIGSTSQGGSTGHGGSTTGTTTGSTGSQHVQLTPEVMLVVDRSGSMTNSITGSGPGCMDSSGNYSGNHNDDCKWNLVLNQLLDHNGVTGFVNTLIQLPTAAPSHVGLMTYSDSPSDGTTADEQCSPGVVKVPLQVGGYAAIQNVLLGAVPHGATPTATSLNALLSSNAFDSLATTIKFVVLLTDGAPNCDADLTVSEASCGGDRCTLNSAGGCTAWDQSCECWNYALGCLDEDRTVAAVRALNSAGIYTFVIGVGAEVSVGATKDTLNQMAAAGGAGTGALGNLFYPAQSQSQLSNSLSQIAARIQAQNFYQADQ